MKQHREEDALKGQSLKNQKAIWDKTLETRFLLQKAFATSNKLPQEPMKTKFCNHDMEIEQTYDDLLKSSKQTLSSMLELQEAMLESNQKKLSASNGEDEEWSEVQNLQTRITKFRNTEIDKWQRKIQNAQELETAKEGHVVEGDPELIDDSEFYQQLLKEFLESCDRGASVTADLFRYHFHEKITNFMATVPVVLPPVVPKLFENLFGAANQQGTRV
ncbi:hypothetical protein PR202_gb21546 [Eleusine coracana subsp. coracana]|uniref:AATF leucine zipper-containing domain-containing protein n=1 Tax=Eleusine coracana subsp. coracana TaxID=191504 RepID=A0AAV5FBD6_ELECO|nr:hypothetical protein PR202_gb21546 [Eleusine coracana subsp. coracana]